MTKQINVTVMIKDGGYASIRLSPGMLGLLAQNIMQNGSERVITLTRSIEVVGVLVRGPQIGKSEGGRITMANRIEDEIEKQRVQDIIDKQREHKLNEMRNSPLGDGFESKNTTGVTCVECGAVLGDCTVQLYSGMCYECIYKAMDDSNTR